jgi:SAM-dependent methyltransferase
MLKMVGQKLDDGRWSTASADRNKGPILALLQRVFPRAGLVLEIGSGTRQHVIHFAKALPELTWQPSDPDEAFRESVRAWIASEKLGNVRAPVDLEVCRLPWPVSQADAVLCINMIHVAPWAATQALLSGAKSVLARGGALVLYGPYLRSGRHTAQSNEAFDAQLRANDPKWGLRDLDTVVELAATTGFGPAEIVEMPANNFGVVLFKQTDRNDGPV